MTFEEKLNRLKEINDKIRDNSLGLEKAALLFEEGLKLAESLEKELCVIERKIEILTNKPENPGDEITTELFSDEE